MRAKLQICVLIILNCLALSRCEQVNEVADFRKLLVSWQRSNEKLIQILDTKDDLNNLKEDFQNGKSHLQNQIIQLNANFTALRNNDNELKEQFLELMTNFSSTSRKLNEEEDKIEYLKNQSQIHENNYISFKDEIQHQIQIQLHASKVEQKQLKDEINALKANLSLAQIKIEAQEEEIRRKQQLKFQDCEDVKIALGSSYTAGVHTIFINFLPTVVYCDEVGYTVIQSRGQFGNPSDYFFREWNDYLEPFGAPGEEHWLGLRNIFQLTNNYKSYNLRIEGEDVDGNTGDANWDSFKLTNDLDFTLSIGNYLAGSMGDSLIAYSNGMKFSTKDRDQDANYSANCAQKYSGAWWYKNCFLMNLNGLNLNSKSTASWEGIIYNSWKGETHSLKSVKILIKAN